MRYSVTMTFFTQDIDDQTCDLSLDELAENVSDNFKQHLLERYDGEVDATSIRATVREAVQTPQEAIQSDL